MKNRSITFLVSLLTMSLSSHAADLTEAQCEEFKATDTFSLSESQKMEVLNSCKARYSSDNALGNCTAFEGEDYLRALKKRAEKECK